MKRWKNLILGIVFSAIACYFFVRGIKEPGKLFAALRGTSLVHFLAATLLVNITFLFRALRWQMLLDRPVGFVRLVTVTIIGYAANNLLPARAGEILRGVYLSRKEEIPVSTSLGSLLAERVIDAIGFAGVAIIPLVFLDTQLLGRSMPGSFPLLKTITVFKASALAAGISLIAILITFALVLTTGLFKRMVGYFLRLLPERFHPLVQKHLGNLLSAFEQIRDPVKLVKTTIYSLLILFTYITAFYLLCRPYQPGFPLSGAAFAIMVIAWGVGMPSAPGYVGVMWFFTQTALVLLAFPSGAAEAVAIQYWVAGYVPTTAMGIGFYLRDQALLSHIARDANKESSG